MTLPNGQESHSPAAPAPIQIAGLVALTICIPTHQRVSNVMRLLHSLQLQNSTCKFEIIVVSNFEDAYLKKLIDERHSDEASLQIQLRSVGRLGVNAARNVGIEFSKAPVVLFLDDDCVLDDSDFLAKHLKYHQIFSEATCIGGPYRLSTGKRSACEIAYQATSEFWLEGALLGESKTQNLVGGNLSIKVAKLQPHLRFDERIDFGGSETEFERRLFSEGHEMRYLRDLSLLHECEIGWRTLAYKAFRQGVTSRSLSREVATDDEVFTRGHARIDQFVKEKFRDQGVLLRLAILLYQRAFEYGQVQGGHAPREFLFLKVLVYTVRCGNMHFLRSSILPAMRSFLYLLKVQRSSKR